MKVRVAKEYVGRNSGRLHKVGEEDEWIKLGPYTKGLIENDFVEIIEETGEFHPKIGQRYYYPLNIGKLSSIYVNDDYDRKREELGLVLETEEEAQKMADWLKAVKVLRQDSRKSVIVPIGPSLYSVWWNIDSLEISELAVSPFSRKISVYNPFPFATEEDAKVSINAHEKEWKIFLGVEG